MFYHGLVLKYAFATLSAARVHGVTVGACDQEHAGSLQSSIPTLASA